MIILSVDYGDTRTGIAVCDKTEFLASPVTVITEKETEPLIEKITDIAQEKKAELIVVGLPVNMDGTRGDRAHKCEEFAAALTDIKTVLRDERLTTVSAHNALNVTNTRGKKRKAVVDAVSAVMILQDYLDYRRINHIS